MKVVLEKREIRPQAAAEIVPQLAAQLAEASLKLPWIERSLWYYRNARWRYVSDFSR